jgi:hypothetical protein
LRAKCVSVTACLKLSPDTIFAVEQFELLNREMLKAATFCKWFHKLHSGSTDSGNHHSPKFFLPNETAIDHVDKCAVERIHYRSIAEVTAVVSRHCQHD